MYLSDRRQRSVRKERAKVAFETKKIVVAPDSEVAKVLEEAAKAPLLVEVDGSTYRVSLLGRGVADAEGPWPGYDVEEARRVLAETAGSWSDLDADALIAEIYRAREEGSRPAGRP